ncbi:MAG: hypothetical protein MJA30_05850, partial [Cytophagales bacterium]|nr:hypothetical protein [Cytophagales bacterium]
LTCCGDGFVPPSTLTASLAKTIRFLFCHPNSKHFRENGTTRHDDPFLFCYLPSKHFRENVPTGYDDYFSRFVIPT